MHTFDEKPEAATASIGEEPRASVAAPPPVGATIAGRYLLESELGRGGHGVVFGAKNLATGGKVAIKMLSAPSPDAAARMVREAQLAAKIASEHVAKVHDVALHEGAPYVVMDHLEGETLAARLRRVKTMTPAEAAPILGQACRGLAPFHAKGIVHRDLKPSNLFLVKRSDGTDLVAILDFGVAKESTPTEESGALTATNAVLGSPQYMAPEQVRSARDVDARADLWSLGVTLHEMLSGRSPFAAPTTPGTLAAVMADTPPPIAGPLGPVVRRCLEKDPAARYANVAELAGALEAALAKRGPPARAIGAAAAAIAVALGGFGAMRHRPPEEKPAPPIVAATEPSAETRAANLPASDRPVVSAPTPSVVMAERPEPSSPGATASVRRVPARASAPVPIVRPPDVKSETADRK
ncbi:MAG: protein kinase [Labilithrix sp.]